MNASAFLVGKRDFVEQEIEMTMLYGRSRLPQFPIDHSGSESALRLQRRKGPFSRSDKRLLWIRVVPIHVFPNEIYFRLVEWSGKCVSSKFSIPFRWDTIVKF